MKIKSVEQAIELFELHSLKQFATFDTGDYKTGNKSYDIAMDCINYLNEHHALETLRPFLKHEHPYVREFAAAVLLSSYQEECEAVLTELVKGNYRFASLNAEIVLKDWKEGKHESPFPTEQSTPKAAISTKTNKSSNKKKSIQSVEEALLLFKECVEKRGVALDEDDIKTYNKLLPKLCESIVYLYDNQQLKLLYKFLHHENHYVRSSAAWALLPLFEDDCIKVLQEIAEGDYGFESVDAKYTIKMWHDGEIIYPYQPEWGKKTKPKKATASTNKSDCTTEKIETETAPVSLSLRLSRLFECPPEGDLDEIEEKIGVYIDYDTDTHELVFRINTFVNPYTQDVESVYQKRLERFKTFEHIATVSADKPNKFGFMQIVLTIYEDKATDDVILQIKDAVDWNNSEWKPNESKVCCKTEYKGAECYFESSWWYVWRAVIKNKKGYERYDFSDESKFDEEMWDLESGEYDDLENTDSFCLISPAEFESIWDKTTRIHKPVPY